MDSQFCRTRTRSSFHQISQRIGGTNFWRWISRVVTWHWLIHGRIKQSPQARSLLGAIQSEEAVGQFTKQSHPVEDSVSIEDYMSRWCNTIQTPNSPTPQEDLRMPRLFSPKERDNLEKYDKFINELSVRTEGGWLPADILPYDEDCNTLI